MTVVWHMIGNQVERVALVHPNASPVVKMVEERSNSISSSRQNKWQHMKDAVMAHLPVIAKIRTCSDMWVYKYCV